MTQYIRALFASEMPLAMEPSISTVEQLLQKMLQQVDQFKTDLAVGDAEDIRWDLEDVMRFIKDPDPKPRRIMRTLDNVKSTVESTDHAEFKANLLPLIEQVIEMLDQLFEQVSQ